MALSGVRDMSVMATPPRDRLAVRTTVCQASEGQFVTRFGKSSSVMGSVTSSTTVSRPSRGTPSVCAHGSLRLVLVSRTDR